MFKKRKLIPIILTVMLVACLLASPAFADGTGDVASAVEGTWTTASGFDYRKSGQFEWTAPAILVACLVFTLTAPSYVWTIIGV